MYACINLPASYALKVLKTMRVKGTREDSGQFFKGKEKV